jgi:hypothetical protein
MGIIDQALAAVILNSPAPTPGESEYADRLAWHADGGHLEDYPGEGWDDPGYVPTEEEEGEQLGWELGLLGEGEPYRCDDFSLSDGRLHGLLRGYSRGNHEREERAWRERVEYEAWLEEMAAEEMAAEDAMNERYSYFHPCEAIEAVGCIAARQG